jgi:hypothetical protein
MAVLDMNRDGIPDYDPVTQDIYLYPAEGTGDPVAWNTNSIVYKYRDQLETRRAKTRVFSLSSGLYSPPVNLAQNQRANYYNNINPPTLWLSENRGMWCGHFYGYSFYQKRSTTGATLSSDHLIKFLNSNNQLVTLPNNDIGQGWNVLSGWTSTAGITNIQTTKLKGDYVLMEYSGNLLQGKKFSKVGDPFEIENSCFDQLLYIDSQDKALLMNPDDMEINLTGTTDVEITVNDSRILQVYQYDSGSQLYGIRDDILYFLGHVYFAHSGGVRINFTPCSKYPLSWYSDNKASLLSNGGLSGDRTWIPDYNYTQIPRTKIPFTRNPASKQSMNFLLSETQKLLSYFNLS